jgi:hypothetical protein
VIVDAYAELVCPFTYVGRPVCPTLRIEPTGDTWVIEWDDEGLETALPDRGS